MPAVLRYAGGVLATGIAILLALKGDETIAGAPVPEGPRLALVRSLPYPRAWSEIDTIGPGGHNLLRIVGGPGSGVDPVAGKPSWSADGSRLAFLGVGSGGTYPYMARSRRSRPARLANVVTENDPVFTPDGREVVFSRLKVFSGRFERDPGSASQSVDVGFGIWAVDIQSGALRRIFPWRRKVALTPYSFAPDGSRLAAAATRRNGRTDVVLLNLVSGGASRLVRNATEPEFSPDGSRLAFVRRSFTGMLRPPGRSARADLYVIDADGGALTRLTRDRRDKTWPSWDPSGERIAFTVSPAGTQGLMLPGEGSSIMEINADGTCQRQIFHAPRQLIYGAAWQPGPGREAGKIEC